MRVVIIGGNAAGMSAAAKARRVLKDSEITVYEMSEVVSLGSCGMPYYIGGFFDNSKRLVAREPQDILNLGIDLRVKHRVLSVNPEKKELLVQDAEGRSFTDSWDKLVIAVGAAPITPPFPGAELENIFTLRTLDDGLRIREALEHTGKHAVIVGAGFIGLELAEALVKQGKSVRVVELENRVIAQAVDEPVSALLEQELAEHGVALNMGEKVVKFTGGDRVEAVVTDKGEYPAHSVILSVGIRPNTAFLADTGLELLKNGAVVVDEWGESSLPDIYAAGDCAAVKHMLSGKAVFSPLATSANKLGRVIGENLGGKKRKFPGTLKSACVKVFNMEAGRTGYSAREIEELGLDTRSVEVKDKNQTHYYPGQEDILLKVTYMANSRKIVAAQSAGKKDAVLRIDALAMAIQGGMTVDDLALADFCYAPPFARTWDVLNVAGNAAK